MRLYLTIVMHYQKPEPIKISVDEILNKVRKPQVQKKHRIKSGANAIEQNCKFLLHPVENKIVIPMSLNSSSCPGVLLPD